MVGLEEVLNGVDLCIATKYRPDVLEVTVDTLLGNATLPTTCVYLGIDADDVETIEKGKQLVEKWEGRVFSVVAENATGGNVFAFNNTFRAGYGHYICAMADDTRFSFPGWDLHLAEHMQYLQKHVEQRIVCIGVATIDPKERNFFCGVEYPFIFFIERDAFAKLGYFDARYKRFGADTHLGMDLLVHDYLFVVCSHILAEHFEKLDKLAVLNNGKYPPHVDNLLFHSLWDHRIGELLAYHYKSATLWGMRV